MTFEEWFERFQEQVEGILQHQDEEAVAGFLSDCRRWLKETGRPPAELTYRSAADPLFKRLNEISNLIRKLRESFPLALAPEYRRTDNWIEGNLAMNAAMKTGGQPTALTFSEVSQLVLLRASFKAFFGPPLSTNYVEGNLLHDLGLALLDKSIPKKIETLIDQHKEACDILGLSGSPPKVET